MRTMGWTITKKYELGLETWTVSRYGTIVAWFLSKAAAENVVRRAMGAL